jgi:hypothetical protein
MHRIRERHELLRKAVTARLRNALSAPRRTSCGRWTLRQVSGGGSAALSILDDHGRYAVLLARTKTISPGGKDVLAARCKACRRSLH